MQDDRKQVQQELLSIEQALRALEISYEQYFAGVEKREPMKNREDLTRQIRQFANRRIMQTDLRFKYQNMATRFHSTSGYWDRILRLMDEGKYHRPTGSRARTRATPTPPKPKVVTSNDNQVDSVYRDLMAARQACNLGGKAPEKKQIAAMLEQQKEKIREKFGDRAVDFKVETRDGKPRIIVKAKK
jgi:hypothetical protein